jgi:acyl-coenzyme A synthetase/AMP-(fatty) acid ligase
MTESASMVTYNHYYRHVVGSVGGPVSGGEIQMRDLEGNFQAAGEEGEICFHTLKNETFPIQSAEKNSYNESVSQKRSGENTETGTYETIP